MTLAARQFIMIGVFLLGLVIGDVLHRYSEYTSLFFIVLAFVIGSMTVLAAAHVFDTDDEEEE
jgi:F0F1-type ATP synthase assembly protein I